MKDGAMTDVLINLSMNDKTSKLFHEDMNRIAFEEHLTAVLHLLSLLAIDVPESVKNLFEWLKVISYLCRYKW